MDLKICTVCKIEKTIMMFHRDPSRRFGVSHRCKDCHRAAEKARGDKKRQDPYWRARLKEQAFKAHCRRSFGISAEEYTEISAKSLGKCACCGELPKGKRRLVLDHNHTTGKVRDMLCNRCNTQISILENPSLLEKAAAYLRKHQNETK